MTIMICFDCGESDDNVQMRELPNIREGGPPVKRLLCDTCDRLREERRRQRSGESQAQRSTLLAE